MNKFYLTGNLTADPTFTAGQEESKNRANFRVAYNHTKDKATFFSCTAWGKSAERVCKLKKGQRVLIEGEIEENEWAGQQGTQRDKQVNVRYVEYLDFPVETQQQPSYAPQPPAGYQQSYGAQQPPPAYGTPSQQQPGYPPAPPPGYGAPPYQQSPQYAPAPPQAPPNQHQYAPQPGNHPPQQYGAPPVPPAYPPPSSAPQGQGWNPNQPVSEQNMPF